MLSLDQLRSQTLITRAKIAALARANAAGADVIPAGWNNNIRWHIGHLVLTPRRLTSSMLGEPIGLPENYNKWFLKGTSPREWGSDPVPSLDQLLGELTTETEKLFDEMAGKLDKPFPKPYETSVGIVLTKPAESLTMSLMHDGIHLGLLLALNRALKG